MFGVGGIEMIRLATSPEPHTVRQAQSLLDTYRAHSLSDILTHGVPGPQPDPEPNPAPDSAVTTQICSISQPDWDTLFDAVTERLQNSSKAAVAEQPVAEHLLGVSATLQETVWECVTSLNRLHAMLTRELAKPQASA